MKKLSTLIVLLVLASSVVFSQEENTDRYPSSRGFITNRFFDNWEISLGAGGQFYSLTGANNLTYNNYAAFKDRLSVEMELSLGKWLTPIWGARVQAQGAWLFGFPNKVDYTTEGLYFTNGTKANVNQKGMKYFTSDRYPGLFGNGTTKGEGAEQRDIVRHQLYYTSVQFQLMCDLTAWIGGYNPNRIYQSVLFGGIGWMGTLNKETSFAKSNEWSGSFGLSNRFRTCKFLDVYIDIKSLVVKNDWYNPQQNPTLDKRIAMIPSLSAGLTFRLPQQDFKRVPHCDYQPFYNQIDSLNAALNAEKDQNNKLTEDLKNAQDSLNNTKKSLADTKMQLDSCQNDLKKKPKVVEKIIIQKPTEDEQQKLKDAFDAIYFETGKAKLTTPSYAPLKRAATILKKYPKVKIKVMGHTDNVGNATSNLKLSQQRADVVRLQLVKNGVNPTNITSIGYGDAKPIADNSTAEGRELNRRTEIEVE